jgi:hypothetical protein
MTFLLENSFRGKDNQPMQLSSRFVYQGGSKTPVPSLHLMCHQEKEAQNLTPASSLPAPWISIETH